MHSTHSDGSDTPGRLVELALEIGLKAIALTDHDGTAGVDAFLVACNGDGPERIPGVEISLDAERGTVHLLGYFIDHQHVNLAAALERVRDGRVIRNRAILEKLNGMGCALQWEDVTRHAGGDVVGRLHFALALTATGATRTRKEAFSRFLAKGKPAYVERPRLSREESIRLIRDAGGVAVLAHPVTLALDPRATRERVGELRDLGLGGVEVHCPLHSREEVVRYEALARDLDLVATGGSDYHGTSNPKIAMGRGFGSLKVPDRVVGELRERRG